MYNPHWGFMQYLLDKQINKLNFNLEDQTKPFFKSTYHGYSNTSNLQYKIYLKVYDEGTLIEICFWILFIVSKQCFGDWILPPSSGKSYSVEPIDRASPKILTRSIYWAGWNWIGVYLKRERESNLQRLQNYVHQYFQTPIREVMWPKARNVFSRRLLP
jgi:hypothetical protein